LRRDGFFLVVERDTPAIRLAFPMNAAAVLQQLSDLCRRKHLSYATEKSYTGWARSYIGMLSSLPAEWPSEQKVGAFLTREAKRGVAAATQAQALNAVLFLYGQVLGKPLEKVAALRVRRPAMIRTALSVDETRALLGAMADVAGYPTRLIARLLYGCGLRVTEPLELRVKDVDLAAGHIVVRQAKGNKDRMVGLPDCLRGELEAQLRVARAVSAGDVAAGLPVALPTLIAKKYPKARFEAGWAWLFPMEKPSAHPRTGDRVRYRMHEVNVQRAVRRAAEKAGLAVKVTPHVLRHTYATHAHGAGAAARDLKAVLGHGKLETTMRYLEARPAGVRSPLDDL
jgi:integron integrase